MNQEKIGKFILSLRKKKNMTQQELANKINVSDKTISKWENGRGMPDLSLIKPLCDELNITINELLSGETISKENYQEKFEENILNTINYTEKEIKKNNKIYKIIISTIVTLILIIALMFFIDVKRMNQNKPVLFSTWGYEYTPSIKIKEVEIYQTIKNYLIKKSDEEKHYENSKSFVSMKIYLLKEDRNENKYYVYAWVNTSSYYLENNILIKDSASSIPYKFIVKYDDDKYIVTDFIVPRDGDDTYYEDLKKIFPKSVRKDMENIYNDGTSEKLNLEIEEQANLYFYK